MSIANKYLCLSLTEKQSDLNFIMSYTMLQSSCFILNKRFIYDHYALREMPVVCLYQQSYFSSYIVKTVLILVM
jgi:hypothetical protein